MAKKKMNEFDVMRSFAIFIILFHHLQAYGFNYYDLKFIGLKYDITYLNDLNRYLGLGIFVYIAGYLQNYSYKSFMSWKDAYRFLLKKAVRILPLYIVALLIFIKLYESIDLTSFLIHVLGLQIALASSFYEPLQTLWYVGLLMMFYMVFVILRKYGTTPLKTLALVCLIPVAALAAKADLNIIDKRFFVYYAVFIAGIYSEAILYKIKMDYRSISLAMTGLILAAYLYISDIYPSIEAGIHPRFFSIFSMKAFILLNIFMLCFVWIMHCFSMKADFLSRYAAVVAYSSYCMYLFHRPFWWLMLKIYYPHDDVYRGLYLALIGMPILLICSYLLQKSYDSLVDFLSERLNPIPA